MKVVNIKPQVGPFVFPVGLYISSQKSSMSKWRYCTFLHSMWSSPFFLGVEPIIQVSRLNSLSRVLTTGCRWQHVAVLCERPQTLGAELTVFSHHTDVKVPSLSFSHIERLRSGNIFPLTVSARSWTHMCSVLGHVPGEQTVVEQRLDEPCGRQILNADPRDDWYSRPRGRGCLLPTPSWTQRVLQVRARLRVAPDWLPTEQAQGGERQE